MFGSRALGHLAVKRAFVAEFVIEAQGEGANAIRSELGIGMSAR
jgi:hypothetical protein